ncbi:SPW repeat domain-containing protein [Aridibaculum aurantiacum]|uniref:SPW repeat domain-containing protein n=1 Tax=Aridibaculum aurantiacum TaxID=2810307 RepID=UPI001A96F705|nr:SPW repeat protein [Aridibaculum aurantiacum]
MRMIGTKTHGYMDYIMGLLLIGAPWILGFAAGGAETWVPVVLGAGVILYSLMTDYELGTTRSISMRTHLMLDLMGGILLAVSPWLFGFAETVWAPHLIFGILEIGASLMTKTHPSNERTTHTRMHHRTAGAH